jgi:hypothetical protein
MTTQDIDLRIEDGLPDDDEPKSGEGQSPTDPFATERVGSLQSAAASSGSSCKIRVDKSDE